MRPDESCPHAGSLLPTGQATAPSHKKNAGRSCARRSPFNGDLGSCGSVRLRRLGALARARAFSFGHELVELRLVLRVAQTLHESQEIALFILKAAQCL